MLSKSDGWLRRRGVDRGEGCRGGARPERWCPIYWGQFKRWDILAVLLCSIAGSKRTWGDKHRNSANGEDIIRVQIIALILHYLAFDVRRQRRVAGAQVVAGSSNIKICTNTRSSHAEFSPEAAMAGDGAFWRVVLPKYLG
jgi:hypothetical protein